MVHLVIMLALSVGLIAALGAWRRSRKLLSESHNRSQDRDADGSSALAKANEDLKASQADLQRRWQYLAEAQRLSHSGTFGWKVRSGELVWSDETYRILGFTRETNPTLDLVFERIHPDDLDRVRQLTDRAAQNGMDLDLEHRILLQDGVIKYVHAVAHAGRDGTGDLEYMGVVTDITERKRAEEERQRLSRDLQESKAQLEDAQRLAHVGHYSWDVSTNCVAWSDELYRIYGLTPQAGPMDMGLVREMVHPDDQERVYQAADEALRSGNHIEIEHRLIRPDGEERIAHALGTIKRNASGQAYEMFGTTQDITERKRAEEERKVLSRDLQESKTRLEEAQRVAHIGHYQWDLIANRVTWSEELYRIYGLTPQEGPIDMAIVREMMHSDDREQVFRTAEAAVRDGVRAVSEHRIVRPGGEVRVVQALGTVKKNASGRAYEIFGTVQDITERKRAEEALRQSQFYLREGQRLAHTGSWAFSDAGHYWSDELFKIYGLDPKDGAPSVEQYLALVHPQDRAFMAETIQNMLERRCGHDLVERIIRPDGHVRYVRAVAVPVVEEGVFKGFVGTTIDVTEHELLTQELRRQQAYLTEAQSLTHVGSWATNFHTKQIYHLSNEVYRLHGFDPNQGPSVLESFWDTIHPEDEPTVKAILENAIRTRTDYDIPEFRVRLPDGTVRYLRTIGHHDPSAEMGYYVGITMDITERKHAEAERERLRQLEADLAHVNRVNMLGELAAALAHEIKQPIAASVTSAGACLRWLAHDPPDLDRARAAASRMKEDGHRAADVINRLRSFYKKDPPPERESVDMKDVIQEMTVLLRNEAFPHAITIHTEFGAHVPNIPADRVQLQQVFMNLMLNAIEAMKDTGGGKLTIRSGLNTERELLISISDTGVGLAPENMERVFDAFHTTKAQGTGMGLAISRSIVEAHGGRIWAINNPGPGATFHFVLPVEAEGHA
jgi:PAS domain S-box-containing protein